MLSVPCRWEMSNASSRLRRRRQLQDASQPLERERGVPPDPAEPHPMALLRIDVGELDALTAAPRLGTRTGTRAWRRARRNSSRSRGLEISTGRWISEGRNGLTS